VLALIQSVETYAQWRGGAAPTATFAHALALEGVPWVVYAALTPLIWRLGDALPLGRQRLAPTLAVHLIAALLCAPLYSAVAALMLWSLGQMQPIPSYLELMFEFSLSSAPIALLVYFGVLAVCNATRLWTGLRERELASAKLAAELAESNLSTLRAQLHPQFLFDSLDGIAALVNARDTDGAARMLTLLAELLRQVLRADPRREVPLAEELRFVQRYLAIEQVRCADRLVVRYAIDDALLDVAVPCFVVQPLVEHALRHGGTIEVGARAVGASVELWVRDDGPGAGAPPTDREDAEWLTTRTRLTQLYGDDGRLELVEIPHGGAVATIVFPRRTAAAPPHASN
jgi:two-component system, LytTR family, sensor kinase